MAVIESVMNGPAAARTAVGEKALSKASGAKSRVRGSRRSRIAEAWRASTETILPAMMR